MAIYIQIPGIPGDSTVKNYPSQFVAATVTWGATNGGVVTSSSLQGKAVFTSITVTKVASMNSPLLMIKMAELYNLGTVVITSTGTIGSAEQPLDVITLGQAFLTSYSQSYEPGSAPMEEFTFAFAKIEYTQYVYNSSGEASKVQHTWDVLTNSGS
jgi:type VI protein secretion system component Hcp